MAGWGKSWGSSWGKVVVSVGLTTTVYARQIASTLKKIKAKGQAVTWVKNNAVTNNSQPWKTTNPGNPPSFPVNIAFFPPGGVLSESMQHLDKGTSVDQGGPRGIMGAVPFTPALNDKVLRGTEWLQVKDIDTVAPNGEVILYKLRFV